MVDPWLAYIDPGAGSLVIQLIIALLVAVPLYFRRSVTQLARRLRRSDRDGPPPDAGSRT